MTNPKTGRITREREQGATFLPNRDMSFILPDGRPFSRLKRPVFPIRKINVDEVPDEEYPDTQDGIDG